MGVKTPAGADLDTFWADDPRRPSDRDDRPPLRRGRPAGDVRLRRPRRPFDPVAYFGPKDVRRQDRVTQLGFAAAADALDDAGDLSADPARCSVIASAPASAGSSPSRSNARIYFEQGASRVSPFLVPMMMPNATAGIVAMQFGWTGPTLCISTACAASANAIGEAVRLIRDGTSDVVMTGGTESC